MSNSTVFLPTVPSSRRAACDRCRTQKIRCPPRELSTESCSRCIRLGTRCVTSYPRPTGRPSQAMASPVGSWGVFLQSESKSQYGTSTAMTPTPSSASSGSGFQSTENLLRREASTSQLKPESSMSGHEALPFYPEDLFDMSSVTGHDLSSLDMTMFFDHTLQEGENQSLYNNYALEDITGNFPFLQMPVASNGMEASRTPAPSGTLTRNTNASATDTVHKSGPNSKLFNLNMTLSMRIHNLDDVELQGSPGLGINLDSPQTPRSSTGENEVPRGMLLLYETFSDASKFLAIIQSCFAPNNIRDNQTDGSNKDHLLDQSSYLNVVTIFNILSVHIQIVILYAKMLQYVANQLFSDSEGSFESATLFPGLTSEGSSIDHAKLQTKILVHAILRQLEMIEKTLCLPVEIRVTEQREDITSGMFDDRFAKTILEVLKNEDLHLATVDGCNGLDFFSCLREILCRIQASLDM